MTTRATIRPRIRTLSLRPYLRLVPVMTLFILYTILWWIAVIGISRAMTLPIDERWAGSSMLALQGGLALAWVEWAQGWRKAAQFACVVLSLAFAAEYIGVATGFPFGKYDYVGTLWPPIFGRVPAPISLAWLMIALGSLAVAHALLPRRGWLAVTALSAVLATLLDACIEPTAVSIKHYWIWRDTGPFYGVPLANFAGWLGVALVINGCAARVLWSGAAPQLRTLPLIPIALYGLTLSMFATIAFFRGYPWVAALGLAVIVAVSRPCLRLVRAAARPGWWRRPVLSTPRSRAGASAPHSPEL